MTDVFISYSRKDIAFARLVHRALLENGLETWIDWQDIPPSADWLAEVYEAIEGADTFVFVISETSLESKICGLEINHAAKHNKRLIPIVIKDVEAEKVPKELAVLNWIFFEEAGERFAEAMDDLVTAITVDQDWVKTHTRIENRALAWDRKDNDRGLLLRGSDLTEAESWLAGSAEKDPQPTALQTQFILKSREDATRRQRMTLLGVGAALVVAVGLGVLAWTQRNVAVSEGYARATAQFEAIAESEMRATAQAQAENAQQTAEEARVEAEYERDTANSRRLAIQSADELENGQFEIGFLLAIESLKTVTTNEAYSAIRKVFDREGALLRIITAPDNLRSVHWNEDESLVLTAGSNQNARVWNVNTGEELVVLEGHEGMTFDAQWNPDESRILTHGSDGKAIVWNASSGEPLWSITSHNGISTVLWNSDGSQLLSAGNGQDSCIIGKCNEGSARIWDAETGEELLNLTSLTGLVSWAMWNSNETQIILSEVDRQVGVVRVHDAQTGDEIFSLRGHQGWVDEASWSDDESRILTLERGGPARIWDAGDGQELFQLPKLESEIRIDGAAWSPNGDSILTISCTETATSNTRCVSGFVQIWNGRTGEELFILDEDHGAITDAIWSKDGQRIYTSGTDGSVLIWNATSGSRILALEGQLESVAKLTESPNGNLLITTSSVYGQQSANDAIVWDIETGRKVMDLGGHTYGIKDAIWSSDGEQILTFGGETTRIWRIGALPELPIIEAYPGGLEYIAWNQDGTQIMTAGCDEENLSGKCLQGTVRIWDADSGFEIMAFSGHTSSVVEAVWNADESRVLTASWDKTARIWDTYTGEELLRLEGHPNFVSHVSWSPDEDQILTASYDLLQKDNSVRIWDAETGSILLTIPSKSSRLLLEQADWNQEGNQIITLNSNDNIRILDSMTGEILAIVEDEGGFYKFACSSDESKLATGNSEGVIKLWDMESSSEILPLLGHTGTVRDLSWNVEDTLLLSASLDGTARVWDPKTGEELLILAGHSAGIDKAYWNNDGSMILTVGRDSTARVWDAVTGDELMNLIGHSGAIKIASWNNNDTRIITGSSDGTIRQWYMDDQSLLQIACERAPRNFSSDEWKRYFGNTTCVATCSNIPDSCTPEN